MVSTVLNVFYKTAEQDFQSNMWNIFLAKPETFVSTKCLQFCTWFGFAKVSSFRIAIDKTLNLSNAHERLVLQYAETIKIIFASNTIKLYIKYEMNVSFNTNNSQTHLPLP